MRNRKNPGLGVVLMIIGAVMLLGMIGVHLGGLVPFAIGLGLLYWGYKKYQTKGGLSAGSLTLFILGGIMTLSGVGALIPFFIASLLLFFGYRYLKDDEEHMDGNYDSTPNSVKSKERSLDEEFAKIMNK
ncbi:hypothetical protein [Alkalicoccobacillus porphyridii]|uniref:LiaF transmembrane domain-containing protein n=1 Tax=Alkalicoccobacillus porphyridii TaxID=2597270 RepID=A0A553ZWH8_9BACI|nr:hypothetical protein [Alkalicoccobacillus porphyridii]TSB45783.1 hypothetical protein FN960_14960 [Alkalicoccobacillus porphyridii]